MIFDLVIKFLRKKHSILKVSGFDVKTIFVSFSGLASYVRDYFSYKKLISTESMPVRFLNIFPILKDMDENAGIAKGHYFFQDLWAAKKIFKRQPLRHIDVGSRMDGFVSHVLCFMDIEVIDIRKLDSNISGLKFIKDDATNLSSFKDNSISSISSLHAAEHFGLGRYNDPVDPDAHLKFIKSLQRVLAPGGFLYFSVPCGKERLEFNAHRVFSPFSVIRLFDELQVVSLDGVKDDENYYEKIDLHDLASQSYGCGFFEFTKASNNQQVNP